MKTNKETNKETKKQTTKQTNNKTLNQLDIQYNFVYHCLVFTTPLDLTKDFLDKPNPINIKRQRIQPPQQDVVNLNLDCIA